MTRTTPKTIQQQNKNKAKKTKPKQKKTKTKNTKTFQTQINKKKPLHKKTKKNWETHIHTYMFNALATLPNTQKQTAKTLKRQNAMFKNNSLFFINFLFFEPCSFLLQLLCFRKHNKNSVFRRTQLFKNAISKPTFSPMPKTPFQKKVSFLVLGNFR